MKKLECIIRPSKFEEVKDALAKIGIRGMTITHVLGCGLQYGKTEMYRGSECSIDLLPKVKVEIVVSDDLVDQVTSTIMESARTGKIGDGKIFVYPAENAIRIRTGQTGEDAV